MSNVIRFYKVNEEYGEFSNFYVAPIIVDNCYWKTVEHYFQAEKMLDEEVSLKIQAAETPFEAAQIGRNREHAIKSNWELIKDGVMKKAVYQKFYQHPDLKEKLFSTGDLEIVEHTSNDRYWADGGDGSGKNILGFILMKVRDELREYSVSEMLPPWIKYSDISEGSIGWRMGEAEGYLMEWTVWLLGLTKKDLLEYSEKYPSFIEKGPTDIIDKMRRST